MLSLVLVAAWSAAVVAPARAVGSVSLTAFGTAATEDFNTLASSGTTNTTVPAGWEFSESGTNAHTTYRAGTGSDTVGDTYSFGAASNTERVFGGLRSGTLVQIIGAQFTNTPATETVPGSGASPSHVPTVELVAPPFAV